MKISLFFFSILVNFFLITGFSSADQNLKFANIDIIIKKTFVGKEVLEKINNLDQENLKKLNNFEEELKSLENEIKLKKNLLSDEELKNEINKLNKKLAEYKKQKNLMVKNLSDIKKKEFQELFKTINPIIKNYMKENSIEILFNSKNVFIGNKNSDLTDILIDEINNKVSG